MKGCEPNWTKEVLKVIKVFFLVEKILKRKNNQVLVKWSGFGSFHNSWISVNDLLKSYTATITTTITN